MNDQRTMLSVALLLVLGSLLLVAAWPQGEVFAQDLVRLTIINPSSQEVWLELSGPQYYNLRAGAGETKVYNLWC